MTGCKKTLTHAAAIHVDEFEKPDKSAIETFIKTK